jgi:uncharacterized protein
VKELKVTKKTAQRVKHIPQRTCVACREVLPKRQMVRIVRTADGVKVDPTGKLAGRGAYLHDRRECWARGLKGALTNALKAELTTDDRVELEEFMNTLPQDQPDLAETSK